jgi:hypothetical protein
MGSKIAKMHDVIYKRPLTGNWYKTPKFIGIKYMLDMKSQKEYEFPCQRRHSGAFAVGPASAITGLRAILKFLLIDTNDGPGP